MRATKELIISSGKPAPFQVPALEGAEVLLRPLSSVEAEEVQSEQAAGIRGSMAAPVSSGAAPGAPGQLPVGRAQRRGTMAAQMTPPQIDMDYAAVLRGASKANILAAHYGLVEPAMSIAELEAVRPPSIVEQIAEEVMSRSGIGGGLAEKIAQFRDQPGGADDPSNSPDGMPAGADAS